MTKVWFSVSGWMDIPDDENERNLLYGGVDLGKNPTIEQCAEWEQKHAPIDELVDHLHDIIIGYKVARTKTREISSDALSCELYW